MTSHLQKKLNPEKRKQLLIMPEFQNKFIIYTSLISIITISEFFIINWIFISKFIKKGQDLGIPSNHIYFTFIYQQRNFLGTISLISALVLVSLITCFGLYISNRIAGPIYRIQTYLIEWKNGKTTEKLKFRDSDYFKELASAVNDCLNN